MNPIFQKVIIEITRGREKRWKKKNGSTLSAKKLEIIKININYVIRDTFFILIGIFSAGFGLKSFLLPNSFIDGGAIGISLLISETTTLSLSILIVLINFPFIFLAYTQIGKHFAIKSVLAIIGLALVVHFVQYPLITSDKLLIAVFGGFFLGVGIGMVIRGGAVIDGAEVLAIYLSKKTGLTIGDVILIFNIIIFSLGAYILSMEVALYAILTYYASSKTVDYVIEGVEEYTGITIISKHSQDIRAMIVEDLGRGVTIYSGKGGFGKKGKSIKNVDIIYTVLTRLEIARLRKEVDKIDLDAFIVMSSIKDTKGGMIKKRPLEK